MKSFGVLVFAVAAFFYEANADYMAAVVEYAPQNGTTPNHTLQLNLNEYLFHMGQAKLSNVQIIVFPEYGLTGLIDDPSEYGIEIPAVGTGPEFTNEVLQGLANAAAEYSMYIVVNLAEKAKDDKNKTIFYNTNIVFDKERKLVARYRKMNLYEEPLFTPGKAEENRNVTFVTDFGVTFGTFICFDIVFYAPSRTVLNGAEKITNVVYPTAWYANLPFYQSISYHYGYAVENKVNFLVANINNVKEGQGGSGIYGADGTIYEYYLSGITASKLLISNVKTTTSLRAIPSPGDLNPVNPGSELDNFITSRTFDASKYQMKKIDVSVATNATETICDGSFCCTFNYNITTPNSKAFYYLMAYRGNSRLSPSVIGPIQVCYILACKTTDLNTCGTRNITETVKFDTLIVHTQVTETAETYYMPYSLTTGLIPIFNTTYSANSVNNTRNILFRTSKAEEGVVVFGIYTNGAISLTVNSIVLVTLVIFKYLFV